MKRRVWYWITDALGLLILLGVTVFVLLRWQSIPAQVPAHFGAGGEITAYGKKAQHLHGDRHDPGEHPAPIRPRRTAWLCCG